MGKRHVCIVYNGIPNNYIFGRISGVISTIAGETKRGKLSYAHGETVDGCHFFQADLTKSQYKKVRKIIETWYPGMCNFENWKTAKKGL